MKEKEKKLRGVRVCEKCRRNAAWFRSKQRWCWWCEGKPGIGSQSESLKTVGDLS